MSRWQRSGRNNHGLNCATNSPIRVKRKGKGQGAWGKGMDEVGVSWKNI